MLYFEALCFKNKEHLICAKICFRSCLGVSFFTKPNSLLCDTHWNLPFKRMSEPQQTQSSFRRKRSPEKIIVFAVEPDRAVLSLSSALCSDGFFICFLRTLAAGQGFMRGEVKVSPLSKPYKNRSAQNGKTRYLSRDYKQDYQDA